MDDKTLDEFEKAKESNKTFDLFIDQLMDDHFELDDEEEFEED